MQEEQTPIKPGIIRKDLFKYTTPEQSFASALRSSVELKQLSENQKESAGSQKNQVANKASGQSIRGKTVNSNAMAGMFVAFIMVQQFMTGVSRAALVEKKVSVITKVVFSQLKQNVGKNS
jgi:hypothetical protein